MVDGVIGGAAGIVLGAMLIGGRDDCVAVLRLVAPVPPAWRPAVAGAVAGTGIAMLLGGAWLLRTFPG
jgi:hypothetical protein